MGKIEERDMKYCLGFSLCSVLCVNYTGVHIAKLSNNTLTLNILLWAITPKFLKVLLPNVFGLSITSKQPRITRPLRRVSTAEMIPNRKKKKLGGNKLCKEKNSLKKLSLTFSGRSRDMPSMKQEKR